MLFDVYLRPPRGEFDTAEIETFVAALPFAARDAFEPHVFLLGPSADTLAYGIAERARVTPSFPFVVTLVKVRPARVDVAWRTTPLDSARQLVAWMRDRGARIGDEEGNDVTDRCTGDLDFLFGPRDHAT